MVIYHVDRKARWNEVDVKDVSDIGVLPLDTVWGL